MANSIKITDNGKPLAPVIIEKKADRVIRFAAQELKTYLQRISGASFSIQPESEQPVLSKPAIYLTADTRYIARGITADPCKDPFDGFVIQGGGPALVIQGHNSRSVLYGVYALLEELGCRFIEPGIEFVPRIKTISVSAKRRSETAAFPLRTVYPNLDHTSKRTPFHGLDADKNVPQIDWMAKRRLNHYDFYVNFYRYDLWEKHKQEVLEALLDRGFTLEVTHHSIHYFCPPDENHDFGDYGPSTYLKNHPDWYLPALECGGRGRWQTRVDKPAVQKILAERLLAYMKRNPELNIVGLWPDDVPIPPPYKGLSATDGYIRFWNRIGREIAGEYPDKKLGIIAYFDITDPPSAKKPGNNLHCWFCPIRRSLMNPIDHPENRKFLGWQKGWIQAMPPYQVANFEYYGWQMEFTPIRHVMKKDLPIYRELGLGGIYGWSGFDVNLLGNDYRWALDMFVLTHLLWNPDADVKALEEQWANEVFREAAEPVLDFFRYLAKEHAREVRNGLAPNYQWILFDVARKGLSLLDEAREKTGNPRIRSRLDLLEKVLYRGTAEILLRKGVTRVV